MPKQETMHTLFERHLQETRSQLQALANTMEHVPPFSLTFPQYKALNNVLRQLDFNNEYALGAQLRRAFRIEMDAVKAHTESGKIKRRA